MYRQGETNNLPLFFTSKEDVIVNLLKIGLLSVLLISAFSLGATETKKASSNTKKIDIFIAKETANYYKKEGVNRRWEEYLPFVYASERVAKMFPEFPAKDHYERVIRFYTYGAIETRLRRNQVAVNIPGVKYITGRVKGFSN